MRLMFVCNSLGGGGAERVVSLLSDSLSRKGYAVYVLSHQPTQGNSYKFSSNVRILPSTGSKNKLDRIQSIRKQIRINRIDTVIAFSHYNAMYSVLSTFGLRNKVRIIGSERNDPAQLNKRLFLKVMRDCLYRGLDTLVCQTDDAKSYFSDRIQSRTAVIMNPIADDLPEPYVGVRSHRVVAFSRIEPQKNISLLINAFLKFHEDFNDYSLEIYGEGSEKTKIENMIRDNHAELFIKLFPFMPNIHELIKDASIFALSSNYEGLSNSMIEAMALGIPAVVTDCPCGGARMVIDNGQNGLIVPVANEFAMADAFERIAGDRKFAEKLSENGAMIRKRLSATQITQEWLSLLSN